MHYEYLGVAERVRQKGTVSGTGDVTFATSGQNLPGFNQFVDAFIATDGTVVPYCIEEVDADGIPSGAYEVGVGLYRTTGETGNGRLLRCYAVRASSNAGSLVSFAGGATKIVSIVPQAEWPAISLINLYVSASGSDTGTGLATGTGAFATPQRAGDIASALSEADIPTCINFASGFSSAAGISVSPAKASMQVVGAGTGLTSLDNVSVTQGRFAVGTPEVTVSGMALKSLFAFGPKLVVYGDTLSFGTTDMGAGGAHVAAWAGARIEMTGYAVTGTPGASSAHLYASGYGSKILMQGALTRSNSYTLYAFAQAVDGGQIDATNGTISGSGTITGLRYRAEGSGRIKAPSGSATFFPGSSAGTTAGGGVYW